MDNSSVRVRPLRYAFLVDPKDKASLLNVCQVTSSLWGGGFNFIIPLFKQLPARYRWPYDARISAKRVL
jgi:hypothetical protein